MFNRVTYFISNVISSHFNSKALKSFFNSKTLTSSFRRVRRRDFTVFLPIVFEGGVFE